LKQSTSLYFKPFLPLVDYKATLERIELLVAKGQFDSAMEAGQELIAVALKGLHYFQTYDWIFLMATVVVGYLGWMLYIILHVLKSYTSIPFDRGASRKVQGSQLSKQQVRLFSVLVIALITFV
jgi:phosphatidylinositol glycan class N